MVTRQISPHAYQLTRFVLFNSYLVRENDGFTVIDTGFRGTGALILASARELGLPIRRIALTHAHGDHVGSVDEIISKAPTDPRFIPIEIELAASARSVPLLRRPPDITHPSGEAGGAIKGSLPGVKARVTRELQEDDLVGSLRVIETPGHIPGHLSFLDERDGTLFAGDALTCVADLCVAGYSPWYFPMPNLFTWNKVIALESARKLRQYPITQFATGHGIVRLGGQAALSGSLLRASQANRTDR